MLHKRRGSTDNATHRICRQCARKSTVREREYIARGGQRGKVVGRTCEKLLQQLYFAVHLHLNDLFRRLALEK